MVDNRQLHQALQRYAQDPAEIHYKDVLAELWDSDVLVFEEEPTGSPSLIGNETALYLPVFSSLEQLHALFAENPGRDITFRAALKMAEECGQQVQGIALDPAGDVFVLPREAFEYTKTL